MRVVTLNLNGIRSATNKGIVTWLEHHPFDILCLQEVRALARDVPEVWETLQCHSCYHTAEKLGYSGVALLSKVIPKKVTYGFSSEFDREGRVVRADFEDYTVLSVYVPSGSSGEVRQARKMVFLEEFFLYLKKLKCSRRELILCGDFNIAHKPVDLKNWQANQKNSGFLPQERAWLDKVLELGYVDTFRELVGPEAVYYSWWSNRGQARANNVGWRLDYHFTTPALAKVAHSPKIYREEFFSDHAPVMINYDI
ncbi:MAG: exodeoxyribonuclease III [Trueperaceae bacterium]